MGCIFCIEKLKLQLQSQFLLPTCREKPSDHSISPTIDCVASTKLSRILLHIFGKYLPKVVVMSLTS